ncbi:MAG: hypothetical protein M5R36_09480 [Deltaproteobacteria bacterium]|nr:hypothetical protein [Deltaproteobacteria bacterium]
MLDGPTLVIGGNYYGDGDDFIRSGAYEIDGATVFGFATLTGYSSREQINLQGLTVDGSTGPFDVAVFGFEPPELTAGEKGADQEALIAAFDADGERVWHSTWDASDQGLLGVPNDFDDNGGALIAAAHTVADDEETRAALLLVDHSDVEAKDTFVFSHLLEVSGTILDTQNTFDTTVFVSYVPEPLGDDDDDDGDDDAGDPVPRMAGVANFIPSGSNDLDTAVFVLDIACLGDDDDDDVVDDDTEDDDMTDDDVTDDDMIDDDAADDDYAEPDDDNDDGGGGPCGDDDDGGGCGC